MNRVGCGRNAVWGGCEECLINSHFQSVSEIQKHAHQDLSRDCGLRHCALCAAASGKDMGCSLAAPSLESRRAGRR